ncbi:MAG: hypothetical protein HYZ15_10535 [Sphingobacteriales bacterium]|nr:hypothetical protein [Sphingobacteriales bacterium]
MDRKELTLLIIYGFVKEDNKPLRRIIYPNEIIARHPAPWDEIMLDLYNLSVEGHIQIQPHGKPFITITETGFTAASVCQRVTAA